MDAVRCWGGAVWLGLAVLTGAGAAAQEPPTILEGLIVDRETGLPVPNVQVRLDSGERRTSDEQGRYQIEGIPPGPHRVALVTARCNVTFADLVLEPGEIRQVAFAVPSEVPVPYQLDQEEQKRRSEGRFLTTAELDGMRARNLTEVLRRVAPEMVAGGPGQTGAAARIVGRTRTMSGATPPVVVLDGIQAADGDRLLRDLRPGEVATLEILSGASGGWAYGTGGQGGVIRITTRRGERGAGHLHPDRCEVPEFG